VSEPSEMKPNLVDRTCNGENLARSYNEFAHSKKKQPLY